MRRTAKIKYSERSTTHIAARDGAWADWKNAQSARIKSEIRTAAILKSNLRRSLAAAKPPKILTPEKAASRDRAVAERRAERAEARRLENEYLVRCGGVLPSDLSALKKLFVEKCPKVALMLTGPDKECVARPLSKILGLIDPYVTGNTIMRGLIRVDLDEVFPENSELGLLGWDVLREKLVERRVALPNFGVGSDRFLEIREYQRPHLIWELRDSVCFSKNGKMKFIGKMEQVTRGIIAALLDIGADPGGMANSCKTKNPLSPNWTTIEFADEPYSLDEIAATVDTTITKRKLLKLHAATRPVKSDPVADHEDPVIASMSNAVHLHMTSFAQRAVNHFRETSTEAAFFDHVHAEAQRICKDEAAALKKAQYVAPWTWTHWRGRVEGVTMDPDARRASHVARVQQVAGKRSMETMKKIMESEKSLVAKLGRTPLRSEVAFAAGVSERTLERHRPVITEIQMREQEQAAAFERRIGQQIADVQNAVVKKGLLKTENEKEAPSRPILPTEYPAAADPVLVADAVHISLPAPVRRFAPRPSFMAASPGMAPSPPFSNRPMLP